MPMCILIVYVLLFITFYFSVAASSTTGPDQAAERESSKSTNKSPSSWSIEEVMQFVRDADPQTLGPHAELFRKHVSRNIAFERK